MFSTIPTHGDTIRVLWGGVGFGWVILRASGQEEGELAFKIFAGPVYSLMHKTVRE